MTIKAGISDKLQMIINEKPHFHQGETEIGRQFENSESLLSSREIDDIKNGHLRCYGIGREVLSFIAENTNENSKTLETGAGCSTLVFALTGSTHLAVTPALSEISLISEYAAVHEISMHKVQFVQDSSDRFLPVCKEDGFDLVLLDGKHAFPWPVIDWFYTADKLKQGGLMVIDDIEMRSVSVLVDFMNADKGWEKLISFSGKTIVFRKITASIHDVAWHMQPYSVTSRHTGMISRIRNLIK